MRSSSRTLEALRVALEGAARASANTRLLDIRELSLPILDADDPDWESEGVRALLGAVRKTNGMIVASPVYQETVSGALKNALDYLSALEQDEPPGLSGRAVGLISVSASLPGMGASLAVRIACKGLGAWVLPDSVDLGGTSFDSANRLCDLLARDRLWALGHRVALSAAASTSEDQAGGYDQHSAPYS